MIKAYKMDTAGRMRSWEVQFSNDGESYCTVTGIEGGSPVTSGWTSCKPKNVGKKNATTASEQAKIEAQALLVKKTDKGWKLDRNVALNTPADFEPMLAQKYVNWGKLPKAMTIYTQPKLDGIRCIATAEGLFTRNGKRIVAVPHIEFKLRELFEQDPTFVLDGELYNHALRANFNEIVSLVRKTKVTPQDQEKALQVQFHIYDTPSYEDVNFGDRWSRLLIKLNNYIGARPGCEDFLVPVRTFAVPSAGRLNEVYANFLEAGYEGQMVRLDLPYEEKRSKTLLKRKEFLDSEFEIVEVQEGNGNWAGYAKRVVLKLDDGRTFGAGLKGDQDFARSLLSRKDDVVGCEATVRYFTPTPDGIPRFPVVYTIHDGTRDT